MEEFITVKWKKNFLLGVFHHGGSLSRPTLLFIHGIPGDRVDTRRLPVTIARELMKKHINSLRIDFYASGVSKGDFKNVTFKMQMEQIECVLLYMREQLHINGKIILVAFSEAAKIANVVAQNSSEVDGVCYCNGILTEEKMAEHLRIHRLYRREGTFIANIGFGVWLNSKIISEIKKWSVFGEESLSDKKSLFIYGDKDDMTCNSRQLIDNGAHEVAIIKGADHLFTNSVFDKKIVNEIFNWISKEYLGESDYK